MRKAPSAGWSFRGSWRRRRARQACSEPRGSGPRMRTRRRRRDCRSSSRQCKAAAHVDRRRSSRVSPITIPRYSVLASMELRITNPSLYRWRRSLSYCSGVRLRKPRRALWRSPGRAPGGWPDPAVFRRAPQARSASSNWLIPTPLLLIPIPLPHERNPQCPAISLP